MARLRPANLLRVAIARCALLAGLLLLPACGREAPRHVAPLWEAERRPFHLGDHWIDGVSVGGERILPDRPAGPHRFKALALSVAGTAALEFRTSAGGTRIAVDGPTPIELDLPSGRGSASASSPEGVVLVEPRYAAPGHRGRRILLVLADALRRDHGVPAVMPEVADYFRDGQFFERAYSPESWTLPVMASLFTGKRPSLLRSPDGGLITLPEGETTLAEALAAEGYFPAAVCANYTVNRENGYAQGFRYFAVPRVLDHGAAPDAAWVNGHAGRILDAFSDLDLFLYLHYMDLHEPYRDHETGALLNSFSPEDRPAPGRVAEAAAAYASSARHLGRSLASILRQAGPEATIVLLADHGEEFGEHGAFRHGPSLHNETIRVPLMIRDGKGGRAWSHPVSTRGLYDHLTKASGALFRPGPTAVSETFAHGPARIAVMTGKFKFTAMARPMRPIPPGDPLERWVADATPAMRFSDPEERDVLPSDPEMADTALAALIGQFDRFRRGIFLLMKGPGPFALEMEGVEPEGWVWGEPADWKTTGAGAVRIDVRRAEPFLLAFLPANKGATPSARSLQGPPLPSVSSRPPASITGQGIWAWLDPGRPDAEVRNIDETLLRLKALGYIQ